MLDSVHPKTKIIATNLSMWLQVPSKDTLPYQTEAWEARECVIEAISYAADGHVRQSIKR